MPLFHVKRRETIVRAYEVEADDANHARSLASDVGFDGHADEGVECEIVDHDDGGDVQVSPAD